MRTGKILAIFGLIASTFAIFVKVMTPTTVQFIIDGSVIEFSNIPEIYDSSDLILVSISAFVMGSSLVYLWLIDRNEPVPAEASSLKSRWNGILEKITNPDEKRIVSLIIDEGGTIFQSQLVDRSGYSKSKVSLILDRLEAKKILERKRHGMSNAIVLK
jgi:GTP-sensing pleiotropic transcriptional regulator CodY